MSEETQIQTTNLKFDITQQILFEKDIPYTKDKNYKQSSNIFLPKSDEKSLPVLIIVHGGSWSRGDRNHNWFDCFTKLATSFAQKGYCCVVPSYRLTPEIQHPDHANDLADCILWVTENIDKYNGNPKEIHLMGHSAGGHLITFLIIETSFFEKRKIPHDIIKTCISVSGVYSIKEIGSSFLSRKFIVEPAFGYDEKFWEKASPLELEFGDHMKKIPFFLINAEYDLGLESQSMFDFLINLAILFQKKLKDFGVEVLKKVYSGTEHLSIIGLSTQLGYTPEEVIKDSLSFLTKYRKSQKSLEIKE